ncbi:MAG: hypothetical protein II330_02175, partial [Clostridia bacterium]|nr:hypothetical protein [Clostridia bacterium]
IYFTEMLNTTLSLSRMIAIVKPKLRIFGHVLCPILCITGATTAVSLLCTALSLQPTAGTLVLQITLTALLYLGLLLVTRCIGADEFEIMKAIFCPNCRRGGLRSPAGVQRTPLRKSISPHKPRVD